MQGQLSTGIFPLLVYPPGTVCCGVVKQLRGILHTAASTHETTTSTPQRLSASVSRLSDKEVPYVKLPGVRQRWPGGLTLAAAAAGMLGLRRRTVTCSSAASAASSAAAASPPYSAQRSFGAAAAAASPARASVAAAATSAAAAAAAVDTAAAADPATASAAPSAAPAATAACTASADAGGGAGASAPPLSFSDHESVFAGQSSWQLLRAYCVLRACGLTFLVDHAEALLSTSRRLLGQRATDALVKASFFAHFCAGEDVSEVQRTMDRLRAAGVGSILDYAAEDDVGPTTAAASEQAAAPSGSKSGSGRPHQAASSSPSSAGAGAGSRQSQSQSSTPAAASAAVAAEVQPSARALGVVGRTYDYASEELCDRHVDHFLEAIRMAARQPGRPAFAAIKMTALGNPALLQRASTALDMLHGLFARFDEDGSGFIDREEFKRQWRQLVGGGSTDGSGMDLERQADDTFRWLDKQGAGKVDYVAWCQRLDLRHMPQLAARIQEGGGQEKAGSREVAEACLDGEEVQLMGALLGRLQALVTEAMRLDVRVMIDAEHTYFQPAVEHVTLQLMRQHNQGGGGAGTQHVPGLPEGQPLPAAAGLGAVPAGGLGAGGEAGSRRLPESGAPPGRPAGAALPGVGRPGADPRLLRCLSGGAAAGGEGAAGGGAPGHPQPSQCGGGGANHGSVGAASRQRPGNPRCHVRAAAGHVGPPHTHTRQGGIQGIQVRAVRPGGAGDAVPAAPGRREPRHYEGL